MASRGCVAFEASPCARAAASPRDRGDGTADLPERPSRHLADADCAAAVRYPNRVTRPPPRRLVCYEPIVVADDMVESWSPAHGRRQRHWRAARRQPRRGTLYGADGEAI